MLEERCTLDNRTNIPILYFHSVAPTPNDSWYKSKLTLSLSSFETLLKYFKSRKYSFVFLDEYLESIHKSDQMNKSICFTFDDGYLDNYVYVYPLLHKYSAKATIFVSPEFVDPSEVLRPTLEDCWNGFSKEYDLVSSGFLSWEEMRIMEKSGVIDIQSHTLTHTKIFANDTIRDFHNIDADWLYPISNKYPAKKPFYISDQTFPELLPFGTPFFAESSAIVTKALHINRDFNTHCVELLRDLDRREYSFSECFEKIEPLYNELKRSNKLIEHIETDEEYRNRLYKEIFLSKKTIECNLNKLVNHICWPHGDYNQISIDMAFSAGYKSVHAVPGKGPIPENSFTRIGVTESGISRHLSVFRAITKAEAARGTFPYAFLSRLHTLIFHPNRK